MIFILRRIVLDTNVVLSGLRSANGASYRLLESYEGGQFVVAMSPSLFFEYEDVLRRPHLAIDQSVVDRFSVSLADRAELVVADYLIRPFLPDEGDDHVLELAIAAGCDTIVTYNVRDFADANRYAVSVQTPTIFLQSLA